MNTLRDDSGFSLIELMVTVAVLAILVTTAVPAMQNFADKNRVIGASEAIYGQLQMARSEAVKQSADMVVVFTGGTPWCMGFSRNTGTPCDCTLTDPEAADACSVVADGTNRVLKVVSGANFTGVTMGDGAPAAVTFNGVRGTTDGGDQSVPFASAHGKQMQVQVNALGRVRLCSPSGSGAVGGYPTC